MPDKSGVADALAAQLKQLGVEVLRIDDAPDADALIELLKTWLAAGPVQGVYWLPALDNEGPLTAMDLRWHEALRVRVKSLYTTMRALYEQIAAPGTFLVSATLLGGQHGYDEAGAVAPMGGAVVGFTKAYKRERTDALVKAVDFEAGRNPAEIAELLIQETLRDPGAVEIGYKNGLRWTVGLQEQPAADGQPGLTLDSKQRIRDHRRGGQHCLRHHRGSGCGLRRHILPARSGARAGSEQSRPASASPPTRTD